MWSSMDRTLEDNMVDDWFFCTTLTGLRGGHTQFVQAGVETSDTGVEAVKPDPGSSWEGHPEGWVPVSGNENAESLWGCPTTPHSIGDLPSAPHACCWCQMNWWVVVQWVQMGVSIWDTVHFQSMDGWALIGACFQAPVARRARDNVTPLRRSSAGLMPARIGRLSAGVGCRHPVTVRKASLMAGQWGVSTAAPAWKAVLSCWMGQV